VSDARGILDHRGYRATDRLLSQTLLFEASSISALYA
jgi:hypothetical protein